MEIQGKYATAIAYADVIDEKAIGQIRRMCDYPFTQGSKVRIMPDVHAGKGCTIGTTMTVHDKAVPNVVGVDIGCGMYTVRLQEREVDLVRFDEAAHSIPSGMDVWDGCREHFGLEALRCYRMLNRTGRLQRSLGTLGGGNHFIEIERAQDGTLYLVIHSGSRNLGKQVAEYYQGLAIRLDEGCEDYLFHRETLIAEYKAAGRQREIQAALEGLKERKKPRTMPDDLCYLSGRYLEDYLADVEACQRFACRNRALMAEILLAKAGLTAVGSFHTIHNYIDTHEMILRKGAIAAHKGEKVLIPINMRDGSILAVGRGDPEWNFSAPHGAGRLMSRAAAREALRMEDYEAAMRGIYTTCVAPATIDEAPMAYKPLEDILDAIRASVDVLEVMRPIYNFKATG